MIKKLLHRIIKWYRGPQPTDSSESFISWLRVSGIRVGDRCWVQDPKCIDIDRTHPELVEIGNHVFLHKGTVIMTHDWAGWCFLETHKDFIPSHRRVKIGNNVWLGMNVSLLGGAEIGDNCIIGYGSVVTGKIPSNSVAIGSPARVICSYEEYYQKRRTRQTGETIDLALAIIEKGREPQIWDFRDDYSCFVDESNYQEYPYPYSHIFTDKEFEIWKRNHHKEFEGFEDFMKYVKKQNK